MKLRVAQSLQILTGASEGRIFNFTRLRRVSLYFSASARKTLPAGPLVIIMVSGGRIKEPKNGKEDNQAEEHSGAERCSAAKPESFHKDRLN